MIGRGKTHRRQNISSSVYFASWGPSINDVTLFWAKIYPSHPCHISSQVFNPPWNITSQFGTPPYSRNYKFPSILCLLRQKFHLFHRFDLCTLWQDQHSIRKTSKILHTLLSDTKKTVITKNRITSEILFGLTQNVSYLRSSLCSRHLQSFKSVLQKLFVSLALKKRAPNELPGDRNQL